MAGRENAASLVVGFAILTSLFWAYRLATDPLRNVPGPFWARFTRFWEFSKVHSGIFETTERKLHDKYGPFVRLAPNKYSISTIDAVKKIYGPGNRFKKADFYHAFGNPDEKAADLFSERDPERHAMKRRKVASLYTMTSLVSYEPLVNKVNLALDWVLSEFAIKKTAFHAPTWMQFYAFDVIGEITVGKSFGYLQKGSDFNGIIQALHESNVYACRIGLFPWLHPKLAAFMSAIKAPIPFDSIAAYINKNIDARKGKVSDSEGNDFLQKLLPMWNERKLEYLDVFCSIGANIAAGSDTTATSLSTIIYYLAKNPSVVQKLRQEMRAYRDVQQFSDPVTFQEAQRMPYLQAVIKEALRIHPATAQPLLRIVPSGGITLGNTYFPAGTEVGMNPWTIHFDREIFGDDAFEFQPERWLGDKERTHSMETCFMAFGLGSRTCIGKNISILEMCKVVPQLYRKYDFSLEHPGKEWTVTTNWFTRQDFNCYVTLRPEEDIL